MAHNLSDHQRQAALNQERLAHAAETWGKIEREKLRALMLAAFRSWCEKEANAEVSICNLVDVMRDAKHEVQSAFSVDLNPDWGDAMFSDLQLHEPYGAWVEQVHSFIRAGLLVPSRCGPGGWLWQVRMTPRGRAAFTSGDHPLSPGFIDRLRKRCKKLPATVVEQFQSAVNCMEKDELRAAVGMVGLAYESAIEAVGAALAKKKHFDLTKFEDAAAWLRVDMVKTAVRAMKLPIGERSQIVRAIDYAEIIRDRRNDGGHTKPRWPFNELSEIENLIVQAGMQLPTLWSILAKA